MKMTAIICLEPDEIQKAVIAYIEKETNKKVDIKSFSFTTGTRSVGSGLSEHDEWCFKGCTVKVIDA